MSLTINSTTRALIAAASTSLAYRPRSSNVLEAVSADGLLLSSPATRICDKQHLEPTPAFGSSTKPTSNLRSAVEPFKGWWGCANGLRRTLKGGWCSSAKPKSWPVSRANQHKASLSLAPSGHLPAAPFSVERIIPFLVLSEHRPALQVQSLRPPRKRLRSNQEPLCICAQAPP